MPRNHKLIKKPGSVLKLKKLFLHIVLFSFLISIHIPLAGGTKSDIYYWFYLKIEQKTDKKTNSRRIQILQIGKDIESGSFELFSKKHKESLKRGEITIGPFRELLMAWDAKQIYLLEMNRRKNPENMEVSLKADSNMYFFLTRPLFDKGLKIMGFQRIPSRIAAGSSIEFLSMLNEGLGFEVLAIGPFNEFGLAEKSKFTFRINGDPQSASIDDPEKMLLLAEMGKKWESVKIELNKQKTDSTANFDTFQLSIHFPENYFIEDASQTITIRPKYSDPRVKANSGITFQGNFVMDNNLTIPFETGTLHTEDIQVIRNGNIKLLGFFIESSIFDDYKMISQKTRYFEIKQ
jgi:hypothetical protein